MKIMKIPSKNNLIMFCVHNTNNLLEYFFFTLKLFKKIFLIHFFQHKLYDILIFSNTKYKITLKTFYISRNTQ